MIKILILVLALSTALSGCFVYGNRWALGLGKHSIEHFADGSVKKETIETKTLLENVLEEVGDIGGGMIK